MSSDGSVAPDDQYTFFLSLWDAPANGSLLWWQFRDADVRDGVFNVMLGGSGASGPLIDALEADGRYLETHVVAGGGISNETLGRIRLTSVPYALRADRALEADHLTDGSEGASDSSLPIGAIVLFADGTTCPSGFELMDGMSSVGGEPFDLRARFPLGADPSAERLYAPDLVREKGGSVRHRHSGKSTQEFGGVRGAEPGGWSVPLHGHTHVINGADFDLLPPYLTVLFCRKV